MSHRCVIRFFFLSVYGLIASFLCGSPVWCLDFVPLQETPSATPLPEPGELSKVLVTNVESRYWMSYPNALDAVVDPRDGNLLVCEYLSLSDSVEQLLLRGPFSLLESIGNPFNKPVAYSSVRSVNREGVTHHTMEMNQQGVLYHHAQERIFRFAEKGTGSVIYYKNQDHKAYTFRDLLAVGPDAIIPGMEGGGLIGIEESQNQIVWIDDSQPDIRFQTIPPRTTGYYPMALTLGPDKRLYVLAMTSNLFPAILRLEWDGTLTKTYPAGNGTGYGKGITTGFVYWPKDRAFYYFTEDTHSLWRIGVDTGSVTCVLRKKHMLDSLLCVSADGESLIFTDSTEYDLKTKYFQILTLKQPFEDGTEQRLFPTALPIGYSHPTETPTATPTPTPTVNPRPVTDLSAWPNLSAEFITMYNEYYAQMTVDPRNQDLYFFMELFYNRSVIIGPIPSGQSIPDDYQSPIYAELTSHLRERSSPRGFFMTSDGVLYIHFYGQILRIPAQGVVENVIPEWGYDQINSPDMYEVKEGDRIPGVKSGNIILAKVQYTSGFASYESEIYSLDLEFNPPKQTLLWKTILPSYPQAFSIGPDRYLYVAFGNYGSPDSAFELYRLELNGVFTLVTRIPSGFGYFHGFNYWPKDNSFYFYGAIDQYLWRLNPNDSSWTRLFNAGPMEPDIVPYQNGEKLLVMDRDRSRRYQDAFVESLSLDAPFPTPTGTFVPRPFATPLPADYPTPTQTATPTPTATATPIVPQTNLENYKADLLMSAASFPFLFAVHPKTGEWYVAQNHSVEDIGAGFYIYHDGIFKMPPPEQYMGRYVFSSTPEFTMPRGTWGSMYDLKVGSDGTVAVSYIPGKHSTPKIRIQRPNAPELDLDMGLRIQPVFVVNDTSRIPFAHTGDVLVGNKIVRSSSAEATALELEDTPLPDYLVDFCEGPDGKLFFLFYDKIYYVDDQGQPREWLHFTIPDYPGQIEYNPLDASFYISYRSGWGSSRGHFLRISEFDQAMQHIQVTNMGNISDFITIPGQNGFYARHEGLDYSGHEIVRVINSNSPVLPTPTPEAPSPTPTPIKGWFVLDGLGGIHSTNPNVPRPVLPYWPEFNIARDIEPDPLGRGWYMLDGFGGIHTSSPDLPRPDSLPYFGFDVARNLEVKLKDGKLEFYLLDGYGVIHTTDVTLPWDSSIWFGADIARDLNPAPNSDEWVVMDVFGNLFQGMPPKVDTLRMVHHSLISPVMRSFVRFPDESTVMVDLFGGRHTNPFYPAADVVNGLPSNFYFPGWDIIRDLEVVPENLSEKRP